MELLRWVLGIMAILWLAWFFTGGPDKEGSFNLFLSPPAPLGSGGSYGPRVNLGSSDGGSSSSGGSQTTQSGGATSGGQTQTGSGSATGGESASQGNDLFTGSVTFTGGGDPRETDPDEEYITIRAARGNRSAVNISNWKLKSAVSGRNYTIGGGTTLPQSGQTNREEPIYLAPGEEAIITSGRSPIGASFRTNKCTGYFQQFQDFDPRLPQECPRPRDEALPLAVSDACYDYVDDLPRCIAHIRNVPLSLASDGVCQSWLAENVNYTGCVALHRDDDDFAGDEWRIFLGRNEDIWRNRRETILLLDENDRVIDSLTY